MDFKEFTQRALATECPKEPLKANAAMVLVGLSLAGSVGVVINEIKRAAIYGKPVDMAKFAGGMSGAAQASMVLSHMLGKKLTGRGGEEVFEGEATQEPPITADMLDEDVRIVHAALGFFSEAGEICKEVAVAKSEGRPVDRSNMLVEFGDTDWFKAVMFDAMGITEQESREAVLAKLAARLPDGVFSVEQFIDKRDAAVEQAAVDAVINKEQ